MNNAAEALISRSVVAGNSASALNGGGGIFVDSNASSIGIVRLDRSVAAKNQSHYSPESLGSRFAVEPICNGPPGRFLRLGGNMITSTAGDFNPLYALQTSDYVNSNVQYVVTSVVDTFDHGDDDTRARSIREAIDSANATLVGAETIWLPAWNYVLTRDRATYGSGATDMNTSFGDLDIIDKLTIRSSGLAGNASVTWRPGVVDKVFELVGDYDGNGIITHEVSGTDFNTWQIQFGSGTTGVTLEMFSADGDDDGDVDGADEDVWDLYYGNTFSLFGVAV